MEPCLQKHILLLVWLIACSGPIVSCKQDARPSRTHADILNTYASLSRKILDIGSDSEADQEGRSDHRKCNKFSCFDTLQCQLNEAKQITYYVYPPLTYIDSISGNKTIYSSEKAITAEYWQALETILLQDGGLRSTLNPQEACLFVPSLDPSYLKLLDEATQRRLYNRLPHWYLVDGQPGTNHIVIDLDLYTDLREIQRVIGRAMLVSNKHDTWTFRPEFDLAVPVLRNARQNVDNGGDGGDPSEPRFTLLFSQYDDCKEHHKASIEHLKNTLGDRLLVLSRESCDWPPNDEAGKTLCDKHNTNKLYQVPAVMSSADYCLVLLTSYQFIEDSAQSLLGESLSRNCVPIISQNLVLPFESLINWFEIVITLSNEHALENLATLISSITDRQLQDRAARGQAVHTKYFKSASQIAINTMRHYDQSLIYPPIFFSQSVKEL